MFFGAPTIVQPLEQQKTLEEKLNAFLVLTISVGKLLLSAASMLEGE